MRKLVLAPLFAAAIALGGPGVAMAASNDQDGLVNVNLQDLQLQVPVSAAVPIGIAANVCDVSVLSLQDPASPTACDATSNSMALSRALAVAMMDSGSGGGSSNEQSGLVNVNVQGLQLQVPVSVAVSISVAANVCDVSILSLQETGRTTCDATSTGAALTNAIARAFMGQ
jgi:uncharacterized protein with ATP-grasp and redox domains